jgi:deazaflavin-dependent oxidoreductase (nitroreductase family)
MLRPAARRLPPLAVLHHRGRLSGRVYETPVQAYRTPDGFVVGLAYNPDAAWAQNILAAGGGELTRGGKRYAITAPRRLGPEARERLPRLAALHMRAVHVEDSLEFDARPIPATDGTSTQEDAA